MRSASRAEASSAALFCRTFSCAADNDANSSSCLARKPSISAWWACFSSCTSDSNDARASCSSDSAGCTSVIVFTSSMSGFVLYPSASSSLPKSPAVAPTNGFKFSADAFGMSLNRLAVVESKLGSRIMTLSSPKDASSHSLVGITAAFDDGPREIMRGCACRRRRRRGFGDSGFSAASIIHASSSSSSSSPSSLASSAGGETPALVSSLRNSEICSRSFRCC